MAYIEEKNLKPDVWYLDSGCSNHMSGNKSLFSDLNEDFREHVKLGDNSSLSVMGKGNIQVHIDENTVYKIANVFYVPTLKNNLISMGQLQENGHTIIIQVGCCQVRHPARGLVTEVKMTQNRMFPLYTHKSVPSCFSTRVQDTTWLWHFRYGHLNFYGLKTLQQKNMVDGLPQIHCPSQICEECTVSKQHRDSFPNTQAWRAEQVLQLIHSDLCRPINPSSNSGKRFFIPFTDDYSRKTWVYVLHEKSKALIAFQSFKARVEKMTGYFIKSLRTDRGGEFNYNDFAKFCEENRIQRQLNATYTPQQNGVSERKNRTILNMV